MQIEHLNGAEWNQLVAGLPESHIFQTWEWGLFKRRTGWQPIQLTWKDGRGNVLAAALALKRSLPLRGLAARLCVLYIPKGPLLDWNNAVLRRQVLADLADFARQESALFVKIDPDVRQGIGFPGQADASDDPLGAAVLADLQAVGWRASLEQIQFRNTVLVDLTPAPDDLLANMKQKTRYNIRLAQRKGVQVRLAAEGELPFLYRMYAETSVRDGFVIRNEAYYLDLWSAFIRAGLAEGLVADVDGEPVAGVVLLRFAGRGTYLNGMSRPLHREKMPTHLLQWEAMLRLKSSGCRVYDLWGAPDILVEADPLWGVYRFKEGFGGQVVRTLGAWDFPARPFWYHLYTEILPRLLDVLRRRGKNLTRQSLEKE